MTFFSPSFRKSVKLSISFTLNVSLEQITSKLDSSWLMLELSDVSMAIDFSVSIVGVVGTNRSSSSTK